MKKERNSKDFFAESNIGKAVTYTLERINGLYEVIKNGLLDVSNNMAERTMRGHAMGRNNYLFCQNEMSAERTCKIYSIIESCKLCKIDPYKYMCEILSRIRIYLRDTSLAFVSGFLCLARLLQIYTINNYSSR